jgi:F-type H+-transporting ATPase subunit b
MNGLQLQGVANVVNFLIFAWVLWKWALPPIKRLLSERHTANLQAVTASEEARSKAEEALKATQLRLAGVEHELDALLAQAKALAKEQAAAIALAATADAERLRAAAFSEIERERLSAVQEIRALVMSQAFEQAQAQLERSMNGDRQRELVKGLIQKVGDGSLAFK